MWPTLGNYSFAQTHLLLSLATDGSEHFSVTESLDVEHDSIRNDQVCYLRPKELP